MSSLSNLLSLGFLVSVVACGSSVVQEDGGGSGGDDGPECCLAMPTCGSDAVEVDQCPDGTCYTVEMCCEEVLCHPEQTCFGAPSCEVYEQEVTTCAPGATCREVSMCGLTILCQEEAVCDGYPQCDEGDVEVDGCPPGGSCYTASMCGGTILCFDAALPEHGCPAVPPTDFVTCEELDKVCNYPASNGCFESYQCQLSGKDLFTWQFIGGGCEG